MNMAMLIQDLNTIREQEDFLTGKYFFNKEYMDKLLGKWKKKEQKRWERKEEMGEEYVVPED